MQLANADVLTALIAFTVLLLVPGGLMAAATGLYRTVPGVLQPALAAALTVLMVSVPLLIVLWAEASIKLVILAVGAMAFVALDVAVLRRASDSDDLLLVAWARRCVEGHSLATWAIALVAGSWALALGTDFGTDGDSFFHAGQALKLARLDELTFSNTLAFIDGDPHPGYLLPAWSAFIGLAATIAKVPVITMYWVAAAPLAVIATLTFSGLASTVLRSRIAGPAGAAAFVAGSILQDERIFAGVAYIAQPRGVVQYVLLPLGLALLVLLARRTSYVPHLVALALVATSIMIVHNSYIAWLGLALVAYAIAVGLQLPLPRPQVKQALVTGGALLAVVIVAAAAMVPAILDMAAVAQADGVGNAFGSNSNKVSTFLGGARLESQWLMPGLISVVGTAGLVLLVPSIRRDYSVAWAPILAALLVIITGLPWTFQALAMVIDNSQAVRAMIAMPWQIGLAAALSAGAWWLTQPGSLPRIATRLALVTIGIIIVGYVAADQGARPGLPYIAFITGAAIVIAVIAQIAIAIHRGQRSTDVPAPAGDGDAIVLPGLISGYASRVIVGALSVLLIAVMVPVAWDTIPERRLEVRAKNGFTVGGLGPLDGGSSQAIRKLDEGSVVLALPEWSYKLMAIAPVYSVGSTHVAQTGNVDRDAREADAAAFYDPATGSAARIALVCDYGVDAIVLHKTRDEAIADELTAWTTTTVVDENGDGRMLPTFEPRGAGRRFEVWVRTDANDGSCEAT